MKIAETMMKPKNKNLFNVKNPLRLRMIPRYQPLSALLFCVSFWGFTIVSLLGQTSIQYNQTELFRLLTQIGWVCVYLALVNTLLFSDYTVGQLCLFAAAGYLIYLSYRNSGFRWFYQSFLILLSARYVNWQKLMRGTLAIYVLVVASVFLCNRLGLIASMNFTRGDDRIRIDWGFAHPNRLGLVLMVIMMLWVVVRYEKIRWFDYLLIGAVTVYCWTGPNCQTVTLILLLLMVCVFIMKHVGERLIRHRLFQTLCYLAYPICFLFSYLASYYYNAASPFFNLLEKLIPARLSLGHTFLMEYPMTLLGQKMTLVSQMQNLKTGAETAMLDNGYLNLSLRAGLIVTLILFAILLAILRDAFRRNDPALLIVLVLFSLYTLSAFNFAMIHYNVFLVAFARLFSGKSETDIPEATPDTMTPKEGSEK